MKKTFLFLLTILSLNSCLTAQITGWNWVRTSSSGGSGNAMVRDKQGNLYVTGNFDQPELGIGTRILYSYGSTDVFVAKYDPQGKLIWARSAGENGPDEATGIGVDTLGNVFITGTFTGPQMFFDSVTVNGVGSTCFFVAKYDSTGYIQWARSSAGGNLYSKGQSLTVDQTGSCYIVGTYIGAGFTIGTNVFPLVGNFVGIFMAKYDTNGNVQWTKWADGPGVDQPYAITTDNAGSLYVTGTSTSGGISFQGGYLLRNPTVAYNVPFIYRLTTSGGTLAWAKAINGFAAGTGITAGTGGALYISGYLFGDSAVIGSTTIYGAPGTSFVTRYTNTGNAVWAVASTGGGIASGPAINIGDDNNLYLAGQFSSDTMQWGAFALIRSGAATNSDMFAAALDDNGNALWALSAGGDSTDALYGVAGADSGQAYVCGTAGSASFKAGNIAVDCNAQDIFIAKIGTPAAAAGIKEVALNESLNIYPNPANSLLNIYTSDFQPQEINIYNIQGQKISEQSFKTQINISNLTNGIYFVEVKNETTSIRQKVVKLGGQ